MVVDPYLYPGTSILKNKLNIKDQNTLDGAEANYTSLRLRALAEKHLLGNYDVGHFKSIHYQIFQDLYDWAGNFRTINIEKVEPVLGGISVEYADFRDISKELNEALSYLHALEWKIMDKETRAIEFSHCLAKIWKIHCFREGNTRTVITFACQFAEERGFSLNYTLFEKYSAYVRAALVAYNAVFEDLGDKSKKEYLEKIVLDALE